MEKLSSKVLPRQKWEDAKRSLKFFWLKKENQACCYYDREDESAFLICCEKGKDLTFHTWKELDDRLLFAKVVTYLPEIQNEEVQGLIAPNGLMNIIDEFYNHENDKK